MDVYRILIVITFFAAYPFYAPANRSIHFRAVRFFVERGPYVSNLSLSLSLVGHTHRVHSTHNWSPKSKNVSQVLHLEAYGGQWSVGIHGDLYFEAGCHCALR